MKPILLVRSENRSVNPVLMLDLPCCNVIHEPLFFFSLRIEITLMPLDEVCCFISVKGDYSLAIALEFKRKKRKQINKV